MSPSHRLNAICSFSEAKSCHELRVFRSKFTLLVNLSGYVGEQFERDLARQINLYVRVKHENASIPLSHLKPRFSAVLPILLSGRRLRLSCGKLRKVYVLIADSAVPSRSLR